MRTYKVKTVECIKPSAGYTIKDYFGIGRNLYKVIFDASGYYENNKEVTLTCEVWVRAKNVEEASAKVNRSGGIPEARTVGMIAEQLRFEG